MWQRASQGGGGVDISDLIGNTYTIPTQNTTNKACFMVGISTIEAKSDSTYNIGMYSDSNCTQLIAQFNNTATLQVDVSPYNVVFLKSSASSPRLSIKVIN